jgi:hypothetical protein
MTRSDHGLRRVWVVVTTLCLLSIPAIATAAHRASQVKSYTGCLSAAHTIVSVAAGNAPAGGSCAAGQSLVHLSGGDITSVTAGGGLSGGSTNGAAALAIANGGVTNARLAPGSVTGNKVVDGSLKGADIDESTLGIVPNADTIDGLDSSAFVRGPGSLRESSSDLPPDAAPHVFLDEPAFFLYYYCPETLTENGQFGIGNHLDEPMDVFWDNGSGNPEYFSLAAETSTVHAEFQTRPAGELITFQLHTASEGVATIWMMSVHRQSDCHVQAQVVNGQ